MINTNSKALGIIFPNIYDEMLPEMTNVRLMGSIPFAARYRMIDFVLSSMANSGIDNISIMANRNYHSLIDHLGSGREWDLVRKTGGLHMFPPYSTGTSKTYVARVGILAGILNFLRKQTEDYVILSDTNIAYNMDFSKMLEAHIASGADVTCAYVEQEFPENLRKNLDNLTSLYYTYKIEGGRITKILINERSEGIQNFSMNVNIIGRELLIDEINTAFVRGQEYFERDVLAPQLAKLNVQAYKYDGYIARITDRKSYFDESMKLLDDHNLDGLFAENPIYTKVRDDNPTRYIAGCKAENIMAADGCEIEGEVENSILFRGVKIGKGAKVKNCILMQDTIVAPGAEIEYVITDKEVVISDGKELKGTDSFPVYIAKRQTV